jgi:hypothetical protein
MTDESAIRKLSAQAREFPETMEIMDRVRNVMAAQLFKTPLGATSEREALYLRVATLDAMKIEMESLLAVSASDKAIRDYAEALATPQEK